MRYILIGFVAIFSGAVFAADYSVTGAWTDDTPQPDPNYTPVYDVEWRVNGGASTAINDLPVPNFATTITANEGDTIEVRIRPENSQGPVTGAWTTWYVATAPGVPTTPAGISGVVITVTPQ